MTSRKKNNYSTVQSCWQIFIIQRYLLWQTKNSYLKIIWSYNWNILDRKKKNVKRERKRNIPLPLSWEGVAAWEPHIPARLHAQGVCHNLVMNNAWGLWDQRRALSSWPQPLRVCTGLYQEHQGPKWKKNKIINTFFGEKLINCSKFLLGMQFFRATVFFEKWKIYLAHYL